MNSTVPSAMRKQLWQEETWEDMAVQEFFHVSGLTGTTKSEKDVPNACVHIIEDLAKSTGDRVTYGLLQKLGENSGVTGNNELEGNESKKNVPEDKIYIDQYRVATREAGTLEEQEAAYETRKASKTVLAARLSEMITRQFFLKLAGIGNASLVDVNGVAYSAAFDDGASKVNWSNDAKEISDANQVAGTGPRYVAAAGCASISNSTIMTPTILAKAVVKARLATPKVQPIKYKGQTYYVCIMHDWQYEDFIAHSDVKAALQNGWWRGEKNPLFSGADIVWRGVIIKKHEYIPFLDISALSSGYKHFNVALGTNYGADCFRSLLLGRQAAVMATTKDKLSWAERDFDYGDKEGIKIGFKAGIKKPAFTTDSVSKEYGVIAIDTGATPL